MTPREKYTDLIIVYMGEVWRVIGVGAQRDGNTFCHLANTSRGKQQKNGWVPHQINDWVDTAVLDAKVAFDARKVA
jgi:hypothetical protein